MLTVTLGLEESGKRRTWRPLGRAYSVMPSTAVIFRTPWGRVWERAVKAKIRRSGSGPLLRVMSHLEIWGFRRIITGDDGEGFWGWLGERYYGSGGGSRDGIQRRGAEKTFGGAMRGKGSGRERRKQRKAGGLD